MQALFVSRTAISKWESGRGYPSIDSLRELSAYFSVSLDDLLSGEEILLALKGMQSYVIIPYYVIIFGLIPLGILTLALQNCTASLWVKYKGKISLGLSAAGALFFMMSMQPYAAAFTFLFLVMSAYVLFELFVINYRPVLIDGYLEASYPSSTTMLVMCVMPTAAFQLRQRIRQERLRNVIICIIVVFTVFMVAGRAVSGVHWFTDIAGGALLSAGLVMLYHAVCKLPNKAADQVETAEN